VGCQGTSKRNNIYDHCDIFVFLRGCFCFVLLLVHLSVPDREWSGFEDGSVPRSNFCFMCHGMRCPAPAPPPHPPPPYGTDLPICHWAIQCDSHAFSSTDANSNGFNPPPRIVTLWIGFEWFAARAQRPRKMMHKSACQLAFSEFFQFLIDTECVVLWVNVNSCQTHIAQGLNAVTSHSGYCAIVPVNKEVLWKSVLKISPSQENENIIEKGS